MTIGRHFHLYHSGIRIADEVFTENRPKPRARPALEEDKLYLAINILESGDNLWYWQHYQPEVWVDDSRGNVPIGWCMNPTLRDTYPLVLNWHYRNATPKDFFFAALSGVGYMNTQVYASRFREEDREWIRDRYVELTDRYCQALGLGGLELYNGTWVENTPPEPRTFERFVEGMKDLRYILADLGRHDNINAKNANYLIRNTPVFHTLTRFRVWGITSELFEANREDMISWLEKEILENAPKERPGFMSAMAVSWYFFPSWIEELEKRLPKDVVLVGPDELAALFFEYTLRP